MTAKTKVIGVRVDETTDARWMAEVLMFTKPKK